jgi:flagellar biosynthesis anti-sigma factor FlgM
MRIDLHVGSVDRGSRAESTRRASRGGEGSKAGEAALDEAQLSLNQARIRELKEQVMALPEVRADKVEQLRAAVADGRYHPPAERVAEAIVAEWLGQRGPVR